MEYKFFINNQQVEITEEIKQAITEKLADALGMQEVSDEETNN